MGGFTPRLLKNIKIKKFCVNAEKTFTYVASDPKRENKQCVDN